VIKPLGKFWAPGTSLLPLLQKGIPLSSFVATSKPGWGGKNKQKSLSLTSLMALDVELPEAVVLGAAAENDEAATGAAPASCGTGTAFTSATDARTASDRVKCIKNTRKSVLLVDHWDRPSIYISSLFPGLFLFSKPREISWPLESYSIILASLHHPIKGRSTILYSVNNI
jgi:hypothetical protein